MIHVHVYKVTKKYECNVDTDDVEVARQKALDSVGEKKLEEAERDCKFIALSYSQPHQGVETIAVTENVPPFAVVVEKEEKEE